MPWLEPLNFDGSPALQGSAIEVVDSMAYELRSRYPATGNNPLLPTSGGTMLATRMGRIIPRAGKRVIGVIGDLSFYTTSSISGNALYDNGSTTISVVGSAALPVPWNYDFELAPATSPDVLGVLQQIVINDVGPPILDSLRAVVVDAAADLNQLAPFVVAGPRSGNTEPGAAATLAVAAAGASPVTYQWLRDDGAGAGPVPIAGATSRTYTFTGSGSTAGTYSVAVTSRGMTVTSTGAVRTVAYNAPAIITQPTAQTITEGGSITLSVAATGTSLTYQWRKDGAPISGATSSGYSLTNAPMSAAGSYDVIVTAGGAASTQSNAVAVTVNTATVMLLHAEGADGSTAIIDSAKGRAITVSGSAALSTARARFGASSLRLPGSSAASAAAGSDFDFSGNFTVEFWVWLDSTSNTPHLIQFGTSVTNRWNVFLSGGMAMLFMQSAAGNGSTPIVGSSAMPTNQWTHVAVTSAAGVRRLFIDGALIGASSAGSFPSGPLSLSIGTQQFSPIAGDYMVGNIDEMRVKQGFAAYTTAFTPPTAPFTS